MYSLLKIIILSTLLQIYSFADDYVVISNKKMQNLSIEQIKEIYLKQLNSINNLEIIPLNLGTKNSLRKKFQERVLHMDLIQLKSYWKKQHSVDKRPPLNIKSAASVKAFVNKINGAIGYINAIDVDDSVKILYRWNDNEYAIIANHSMKKLSLKQIKAIFLKELTILDGIKFKPINAEPKTSLRMNFEDKILKTTSEKSKLHLHQYYKSQTNIKTYVKKFKGGIGYIDAKNIDNSIKVLYKWKE
ncbi:MAG: hypothetical protein L3J44_06685 [Campylobacteraceae bacterium]|nr:hypothetical protein [Campylobacteraceae bacterium]